MHEEEHKGDWELNGKQYYENRKITDKYMNGKYIEQ